MTIIGMTVESEGSVSGHQEAMVILFYCFDKISHNSDRLKVESIIYKVFWITNISISGTLR